MDCFIKQLEDGTWYNKSGLAEGTPIPVEYVLYGPIGDGNWYAHTSDGPCFPVYIYETIFFAVKKGGEYR